MTTRVIEFNHLSASLKLTIWDAKNASLSDVYSAEKGKGHATKLLGKVMNFVDESGVTIFTAAEAYGSEPRLSNAQLKAFYEKFGFVVVNEDDPNWIEMERKPK